MRTATLILSICNIIVATAAIVVAAIVDRRIRRARREIEESLMFRRYEYEMSREMETDDDGG